LEATTRRTVLVDEFQQVPVVLEWVLVPSICDISTSGGSSLFAFLCTQLGMHEPGSGCRVRRRVTSRRCTLEQAFAIVEQGTLGPRRVFSLFCEPLVRRLQLAGARGHHA